MKVGSFFMLLLLSQQALSTDLGKYGADFKVAETSMLSLIQNRLGNMKASGRLDELNQDFVKRVKKHINEPKPLNLPKATQTRSFPYYPVITLSADILDADNKVIAPKGLKINALDKMPYYFPYWLFVDGGDKAQVDWVKSKVQGFNNAKIILTGGQIKKSAASFNQRVYFDQEGRLTKKLGIKHVPASVVRKGEALLITEHNIDGGDNA